MKVKFTTEDPKEIQRLAKAEDMASFIFDLVYNHKPEDKISDLLEKYNIDIDSLIE